MAIRFVIGRAGTGKTHHCLAAVQSLLRQDPIRGPRLILLVPEQAALQAERSILAPDDIPGMHRAEVVSFRRLAFKVLDAVGGPPGRALSEPARAMVIRHLLGRHAGQLRYYRNAGRLGGFIDRIAGSIAELIQETVSPGDLSAIAGRDDFADSAQQAKLHDVSLIYQSYLDYLGSERTDPTQHLALARPLLNVCPWLHEAMVWVDGFASLSRQELLTLVALARHAGSMDVTALMDPALAQPGRTAPLKPATVQLFAKTARTYADLQRAFVDAGLEVDDPLILKSEVPHRFAHNEALAQLERRLFSSGESNGSNGPDRAAVELVAVPSRRLEVEYAVSRIVQWVQDRSNGLGYRDLAIIVRDHEPYHDLVREGLTARGIPFFIDRRRSTAHHPFIELLRAGVALAAEPFALGPVRMMLKTGMLSIEDGAADELENFLLARGQSGREAWEGGDWEPAALALTERDSKPSEQELARLARVNKTRRAFLERVGGWLEEASSGGSRSGREWVEALCRWLERMNVGEVFANWCAAAEAGGDADAAAEHRQIWRDVFAFLDDLAFAFEEVPLSLEELGEVLESGLAGMSLGLAPPMVDCVLVGSIERSRHPEIKAAVVMGFNDGIFPARIPEDSVLNDDDRDLLRDAGVGVPAASREAAVDESLLVYVTLTRASRALVVTYTTADEQGGVMHVSRCAQALRQACPGLIERSIGDPMRTGETWDVMSHRDLTRRLAAEFRERPEVGRDDPGRRGRWNELYASARGNLTEDAASRWALTSLKGHPQAGLSPASVSRLTGKTLTASVSLLETYAACPFQYFGKYGLRLRERELARLEPVDVGKVHHAILEDFVNQLALHHRGLNDLDEAEFDEALARSNQRVLERLPEVGAYSDARNAYLMSRVKGYLARVLRAQRRAARAGCARPAAAEVPFGFDLPGSLPAVELTTPKGRQVRLRGFIDRVDLAELGDELLGIVIDYKRTHDKKLSLAQVYHGISLQLPGYLLALAERGESLTGRPVLPIAALYVSLREHYQVVDHPDELSEREAGLQGTYRPRGLLLHDRLDALDHSTVTGWSEHFSAYRKKDGTPGMIDAADTADAASFEATLRHTRTKLGELADGILDGDVAVRPYRLDSFSPCSWCSLAEVCRMETGLTELRFLESLSRSEVFRRISDRTEVS